jgi:hypothetical protein
VPHAKADIRAFGDEKSPELPSFDGELMAGFPPGRFQAPNEINQRWFQ